MVQSVTSWSGSLCFHEISVFRRFVGAFVLSYGAAGYMLAVCAASSRSACHGAKRHLCFTF